MGRIAVYLPQEHSAAQQRRGGTLGLVSGQKSRILSLRAAVFGFSIQIGLRRVRIERAVVQAVIDPVPIHVRIADITDAVHH